MEGDYEELYKWIEEHTISRPKRNINRDFADAVPLAEILKHHYPKLVDMHNYSSRNSFSQKLINWETLNNKVLRKIRINMPKKRMEQLAKAEAGAIEKLLLEIKQRTETKNNSTENCEIYYLDNSNPSSIKEHPAGRRIISSAAVAKMQADLEEKAEAITILKNKVEHLENLLSIKEERIKDLTIQLQTIVNESTRPDSGQGSKFFGFFQSNTAGTDSVKNEA